MVLVRWPTALAVGIAVVVGATSLSAQPTYTVIANLGDIGGHAPLGGVIRGADGALYGTTSEGGAENCGLVYRIDPTGTLSRVHEFSLPDGCKPVGELALGPDGGLYGVASDDVISGGRPVGYGTIYKVDADGAFTVLHRFVPASPGDPEPWLVPSTPYAGLMLAPDGFFYGTARSAEIYRISPDGAFAVIRGFLPPAFAPTSLQAALTMGSDGYLYTSSPTFEMLVPRAGGTYFRVTTAGDLDWAVSFLVLLNPDNGSIFSPQGAFPSGEVAAGPDGEIYGNNRFYGPNPGDAGTILRLRPGGDVVVLYAFAAGVDQAYSDGAVPQTGLILGSDGYIYGTTSEGGANGNGTIFRMSRDGGLATLRSFAEDGFSPTKGRLFEAAPGVFYGTAPSATGGVVYELRVADALLAESRLVTTNEDQTVEGVLTATGAGPSATFALVADGSRGVATIDPVTGAFTYTPDADVNGSDSFTFSVADGTQQSNLATVTVRIVPVNDPPVALDSSLTTAENTPVEGTLSAQDDSRAFISFAIVATPTKGTVELTQFSNRFTYTPAPGATGADSFTFQASDFQLDSNIATVSITIVPVPLTVSLVAPVGGDKLFVGIPTTTQWTVSGAVRIDLLLARRGGRSFDPIPECTGLAGTSSDCTWTPTGPPTQDAQLRVVAYSASGDSVSADTGEVRISAASPRIKLQSPHGRVAVAIGTVETVAWTHNLGARSLVRVELSRDGGATWEVIAAAVPNVFDHDGAVNWLVSGPPTSTALLRVTSLSTNVSDVTNRVFTIAVSETPP